MGVTWIEPVEITPGTAEAWTDVDLSSYIATGATGVILHADNPGAISSYQFGYRRNGSTDNRHTFIGTTSHVWCAVGVDENRIAELYVEHIVYISVYLVGYFDSDTVFNTNAPSFTLTSAATWQDVDINVSDSAIGALLEIYISNNLYEYGLRKNGSTDDRYMNPFSYHCFGVIGVDENEIFEAKVENTVTTFYLQGYLKSGATFNTNATDISIETTGSYADLTALPSGSTGGIVEIYGTSPYMATLRKNGSSSNILQDVRHTWAMVECDESQLIEGYIENAAVDFYLTGYTDESAPTPDFTSITAIKVWNNTGWVTVP